MDCRGLVNNLLASLNLLEVTQYVTGNDPFAFETSCFRIGNWMVRPQSSASSEFMMPLAVPECRSSRRG